MSEESSSRLMKRRDAIQEDETTTILSTLGFGDSNSDSPDYNSSPPEAREASEESERNINMH